MAQYQQFRLTPARLLTAAANVLHEALVDSVRADAKRRFREIQAGRRVALVRLRMDDDSELQMNLSLDASLYAGELRFSPFRQHVMLLLHGIAETLRNDRPLNLMNDESGQRLLFHLPAIVTDQDDPAERVNALVLGVDVSLPGEATLQLMYVDPEQYRRSAPEAGANDA